MYAVVVWATAGLQTDLTNDDDPTFQLVSLIFSKRDANRIAIPVYYPTLAVVHFLVHSWVFKKEASYKGLLLLADCEEDIRWIGFQYHDKMDDA